MNKVDTYNITVHDIYDIWYIPWWKSSYFWVMLCLGLFVSILLIYWYIKKRRSKKKSLTPWEAALCRLHAINLQQCDDYKTIYFEITFILKSYLSVRFSYELEGKTDQEVITFMQNTNFPKDLLERLEKIFLGSTLIKFAQEDVVFAIMEQDIKRSIDIIRNTIPKNNT